MDTPFNPAAFNFAKVGIMDYGYNHGVYFKIDGS
jgi:hypothetical protein